MAGEKTHELFNVMGRELRRLSGVGKGVNVYNRGEGVFEKGTKK